MSTEEDFLIVERLNSRTLNYIQSVLAEIRTQVNEYGTHLITMNMPTAQGIRDNLGVFTAQLADMYGDIVSEHEMAKYEYAYKLRLRHQELWNLYQSEDLEINPGGKLSRSVAQDKARYQSVIDCYPFATKIAKLKGLEEQANAIWRYTIPKLLDSIASRIALAKEFPNGIPTATMPMSQRHRSNFNEVFGDLEDQVDKAAEAISDIAQDTTDFVIPEDSAFNNPDL